MKRAKAAARTKSKCLMAPGPDGASGPSLGAHAKVHTPSTCKGNHARFISLQVCRAAHERAGIAHSVQLAADAHVRHCQAVLAQAREERMARSRELIQVFEEDIVGGSNMGQAA